MRLNLGCGYNKPEGWFSVDSSPACEPDLVLDLNQTPWPWETNTVSEVMMHHSLEHMGETTERFLAIMCELYRVCKDEARISLRVPHPRHDAFICDPTHVRIITPATLDLFNRHMNDRWIREHKSNTPLAHYLGVDFRVLETLKELDEPYATQFNECTLSEDALTLLEKERNNVILEYKITLEVRKDADF